MRILQTISQQGAHLVLTLTEQPSGRVLARRVWEGAAKYIRDEHDGTLIIRVPISSELGIRPKTWGQA